MEIYPRITVEAGKCGGKPCIRGQRLTVEHVLARLGEGATEAELLAEIATGYDGTVILAADLDAF